MEAADAVTTLAVRYEQRAVGVVRDDERGRFCFRYDPRWLAGTAFPISLSLPLREEEYVEDAAHAFFSNLLPEGLVRDAVCARLGISRDNDVALLAAIGGECAGALRIVPVESDDAAREPEYERLTNGRLQTLVDDDTAVPLLVGGVTTRLSLAGAQDKVPVTVLDGEPYLPLHGSASSHILKLPNARYAHITSNEAFVLDLARRCGLETVDAVLTDATKPASLLVRRYDRIAKADDVFERVHQEDLCQALGVPSSRKYEHEGGPSFVRVLQLVRDHSVDPLVDTRRLLLWQAFNLVSGNSDGHAKNLSLVYEESGPRLAPFYDLLSTREYANLKRELAMSVGGRANPDEITAKQWAQLARDAEIGTRVVHNLVQQLGVSVRDALPACVAAFRERYGDAPVLQTLPEHIRKRAEKVLRIGVGE
jgi:serine/threonine-protein kinase HipA